MTAAMTLSQTQCLALIMSGPDRGKKYRLHPPFARLGRELSNHIVLNDPKASRNHAEIFFLSEGLKLIDRSGKKAMKVNGKVIESQILNHGDIIEIGQTQLSIQMVQAPAQPQSQLQLQGLSVANVSTPAGLSNHQAAPGRSSSLGSFQAPAFKAKRPVGLYIGLGIFGIIVVGALTSSPKKVEEKIITTPDDVVAFIQESQKRQIALESGPAFSSFEKKRKAHAEEYHDRGFRDYQKGNYIRALESFQAALAADPQHELSQRYYRLAWRKSQEEIDSYFYLGRRYFDKSMFSRCQSFMEKVMVMTNEKEDPRYQQAKELRRECELRQGGK